MPASSNRKPRRSHSSPAKPKQKSNSTSRSPKNRNPSARRSTRSTTARRTHSGSTTRSKSSKNTRRTGTSRPRPLTIANPDRLPSSTTTFAFECTRQGCGYRIYREEKAEPGQLRFDIKCPKCHNEEFRCLGKGDYPEVFQSINATPDQLDFSHNSPVGVGSN